MSKQDSNSGNRFHQPGVNTFCPFRTEKVAWSATEAHVCAGNCVLNVIFKRDICHKWLWSHNGNHKVSLRSVYLKESSNMFFLVEVNHCIGMYPPVWTEPLTCRLQMRTCNQVNSSHGYLLPPRGVSVPCTKSRWNPRYTLTAPYSCPSGRKNK